MSIFGNISIETFLTEYWQKKPLLVRNAFPNFKSPVEADELAGLALIEDVESRIILENGPNNKWELECGPFTDERFESLPETNWTLLVQAVDQWVPEMADLLENFKFIPSWRLDDIMVSFAPKGGSVGPHFDQYDVFLLQAEGQRKWQLGPKSKADTQLRSDTSLCILEKMHVSDEWIVNPGDLLYIPPMYSHNGVAQNDCMTFSVGFRAPSKTDIIHGVSDLVTEELTEFERYSDQDLDNASKSPAHIDPTSIERLIKALQEKLLNETQVSRWLAENMTESKYEDLHEDLEEPLEWEEVSPFMNSEFQLIQNETTRWAYFTNDQSYYLFVNGIEYQFERATHTDTLLSQLANHRHTPVAEVLNLLTDENSQNILLDLINANYLYFEQSKN